MTRSPRVLRPLAMTMNPVTLGQAQEKNAGKLTKAILKARLRGIDVVDVLEMYQVLMERIKRLMDFSLSSLVLLISLPLWPFIALLIKMNSPGPVFYVQNRLGKNETVFSLHKFRSMIERAEEDEPVWAEENDKRVTAQ